MKMPEKYDLLVTLRAAKEQRIGAISCLQWRTMADIMAVRLQK